MEEARGGHEGDHAIGQEEEAVGDEAGIVGGLLPLERGQGKYIGAMLRSSP